MKQFIVVGLGRFGASVAKALAKTGNDVLAIDIEEEKVQNISNEVTQAVKADSTDEEALRVLGVSDFDVAVVGIGEIEASILSTLILKEQGISFVIAKALDDLQGKVLSKIGADRVVYPESEMGERVAHNLAFSNILDYIELTPEYSIVEIRASREMAAQTLLELDFRNKFGVSVIGIKHGDEVNFVPGADDVIEEGDTLIVIGDNETISKFKNME